jgi:exopolysaccharide biosynthesis protein
MKHHIAFVLLLLLPGLSLLAQDDSVTFTTAQWKVQQIAKGITLKQYHFTNKTLFKSNQHISILDVTLKRKNSIALGYEHKLLKPTSEFGKTAHAIAAINGTFFDVKNGGSVDYLKVSDSVISTNRLWANNTRARHQQAALVIRKGKLRIVKWDGSEDWETKLDAKDIMLSGPLLLYQQQVEPLDTGAFNHVRHPRSAIAVLGKKHVLLITVDGRHENAAGMSLAELTRIIQWLKAKDGLNLDGGGSTTLWIQHQGVVNYPSDNKKWDHEGERKVANVVLIKQK